MARLWVHFAHRPVGSHFSQAARGLCGVRVRVSKRAHTYCDNIPEQLHCLVAFFLSPERASEIVGRHQRERVL